MVFTISLPRALRRDYRQRRPVSDSATTATCCNPDRRSTRTPLVWSRGEPLFTHNLILVGATTHAGDLIPPAAMIVAGKASLFGVAGLIVPHPNRAEHLQKAVFASQDALVFNRGTCGWARLLARFRR